MVNVLEFESLQAAWEGINMFLATADQKTLKEKGGGGMYGTEYISYNNLIIANSCWVDPKFDFGKVLGYTPRKWTTLVNNYVDFNYLDMLRSEITMRRGKNAKSYNYAFHFSNHKGGGKDCLISLVFSKRVNEPFPTVFFNVRTSEVTSRLIFDFLLVQRIVEYVYGKGQPAEIHFYAPSMFITAERFAMFAKWKGFKKIKEQLGDDKFQKRVKQVYRELKTTPLEQIRYKVHQRCAEIVQGVDIKGGQPESMTVKSLKLSRIVPELDNDVVAMSKMKQLRKDAGIF